MSPHQRAFYNAYLVEYYQQSHRAFHTEQHINEIFKIAKDAQLQLTPEQVLAIMGHDLVYIPGSPNNEHTSCLLLDTIIHQSSKIFNLAFPLIDLKKVGQIIMDTKEHKPTIEESKVVLDLDMAIMGADPLRYVEYVHQVRCEFAQYSPTEFNAGRAKFLKSMMHVEIYCTTEFHSRFYNQAQTNIDAELVAMGY